MGWGPHIDPTVLTAVATRSSLWYRPWYHCPCATRAVGRREKLLDLARRSPHQLRFRDALWLAQAHGFEHVRTKGSHTMLKSGGFPKLLNLQNVDGLVPAYQVRQLLAAIDALADRPQ
jgi:hypothetical protein